MIRGVWIDLPPGRALKPATLARMAALKLDELAVMVDGPKPGLADATWAPKDLERFAKAVRGWAKPPKLILTIWGTPTHAGTRELRQKLPALLNALETRTVETDDEEQIDRGGDYQSLEAFAIDRIEALLLAGADELELTVYPSRLKRTLPLVLDAVRRVVLQTYAVDRRRDKSGALSPVAYGGRLGPIEYPARALKEAHALLGDRACRVELAAGLAAYHQDFPWHSDIEAMQTSRESAISTGLVERERWWSMRHLLNVRRRASWLARTI